MSEEPGFAAAWNSIPWLTRKVSALVIILFVVYCLLNPWAILGWRIPGAPIYEVWRWILAPFSYRGPAQGGFLTVFVFCTNLHKLESTQFTKRSTIVYYILWIILGFDILGPRFGFYNFLSGVNSAMTWSIAQYSPLDSTKLMGIIPIQLCYLPLVMVLMDTVLAGSLVGGLEAILGILLAHSHLYLTELLPEADGPRTFAEPPRILKKLDDLEIAEAERARFGKGNRLG